MPQSRLILKGRDTEILRLLDRTPSTAPLILKASATFDQPFDDLRRVRERMQALSSGGFVRSALISATSAQAASWYRLTPDGFRLLYGADAPLPHKTYFMPMPPSRQEHARWLAEVVVQTMVAAKTAILDLADYRRENSVVLSLGAAKLKPDGSMQLKSRDGREFNFFLELDNGTEPVRSKHHREHLERKVRFYERLQDAVLAKWNRGRRDYPPPRYRVLFFTHSIERQKHLLRTSRLIARNPDRRLVLGISLSEFLSDPNPLRSPIALDHFGQWHAVVSEAYESCFLRRPLELQKPHVQLAALELVT